MSGELEVKIRKKSGSSTRSSRSGSSSFKAAGKPPCGGKSEEGERLEASSSSCSNLPQGSSNVNVKPIASPNPSYPLHELEQRSSTLHQTSSLRSGGGHQKDSSDAGGASSFSSRLSLKSLRGRKSPVKSQGDQIPGDSISSYVSQNNPNTSSYEGVAGAVGGVGCNSGSGCSSSRVLSVKSGRKGDTYRGASASPPSQRSQCDQNQPVPCTSSSTYSPSKAPTQYNPSTNPIPGLNLSTKIETEPADQSIAFIPGTSAPISVDRVHSVKISKKILNWRTKTKDLIRRWKTLPENHSDFEKCPEESPTTSKKKVCSTSNLNNSSGSPGLGKKKNKSSEKAPGKSESGIGDKKQLQHTSSSGGTCNTLPKRNEPVKDSIPVPSISNIPKTPTTPIQTSQPNLSCQRTPELQTKSNNNLTTSNLSGPTTQTGSAGNIQNSTNTSKVSFQTPSLPKDNERIMPAIGTGKDGPGGGHQHHHGQGQQAPGMHAMSQSGLGGRLSTVGGLMTGIGRPSISVNNPSALINGRRDTLAGVPERAGGGGGVSLSGAMSASSASSTDQKSSWTVHVWTTYVQRDDLEQGLDSEEPKKPDREYLSDFQRVKLTHFFRHVLDMNHDDVISAEDFVALNQRIRHYIEWSPECIEFHILKEVHSGFLECFLNQPLDNNSVMYYCNSERETRQNVNIEEWLDVWGGLLHSARTMEALPLWLQYFPKILFQVINKSGSGTISREELRAFYTMFLGIDFRVVNETLESIHNAMTDGGRHKITYDLFKLCFANFLLAKYPNGPGQYLFGIVNSQTLECSFPIDYSALNTHPDDLEPYDPEKDKSQSNRRSVIV